MLCATYLFHIPRNRGGGLETAHIFLILWTISPSKHQFTVFSGRDWRFFIRGSTALRISGHVALCLSRPVPQNYRDREPGDYARKRLVSLSQGSVSGFQTRLNPNRIGRQSTMANASKRMGRLVPCLTARIQLCFRIVRQMSSVVFWFLAWCW